MSIQYDSLKNDQCLQTENSESIASKFLINRDKQSWLQGSGKGVPSRPGRKARRKYTAFNKRCITEGSLHNIEPTSLNSKRSKSTTKQNKHTSHLRPESNQGYYTNQQQVRNVNTGQQVAVMSNDLHSHGLNQSYDPYQCDDEEEGSTMNLRGFLFNKKSNPTFYDHQQLQPPIPQQGQPTQLQHQAPNGNTTICNIQNCYVQIQLNQFDGPRNDFAPRFGQAGSQSHGANIHNHYYGNCYNRSFQPMDPQYEHQRTSLGFPQYNQQLQNASYIQSQKQQKPPLTQMHQKNLSPMYNTEFDPPNQFNFPTDQRLLGGMYMHGQYLNQPHLLVSTQSNHQNQSHSKQSYVQADDARGGEFYQGFLQKNQRQEHKYAKNQGDFEISELGSYHSDHDKFITNSSPQKQSVQSQAINVKRKRLKSQDPIAKSSGRPDDKYYQQNRFQPDTIEQTQLNELNQQDYYQMPHNNQHALRDNSVSSRQYLPESNDRNRVTFKKQLSLKQINTAQIQNNRHPTYLHNKLNSNRLAKQNDLHPEQMHVYHSKDPVSEPQATDIIGKIQQTQQQGFAMDYSDSRAQIQQRQPDAQRQTGKLLMKDQAGMSPRFHRICNNESDRILSDGQNDSGSNDYPDQFLNQFEPVKRDHHRSNKKISQLLTPITHNSQLDILLQVDSDPHKKSLEKQAFEASSLHLDKKTDSVRSGLLKSSKNNHNELTFVVEGPIGADHLPINAQQHSFGLQKAIENVDNRHSIDQFSPQKLFEPANYSHNPVDGEVQVPHIDSSDIQVQQMFQREEKVIESKIKLNSQQSKLVDNPFEIAQQQARTNMMASQKVTTSNQIDAYPGDPTHPDYQTMNQIGLCEIAASNQDIVSRNLPKVSTLQHNCKGTQEQNDVDKQDSHPNALDLTNNAPDNLLSGQNQDLLNKNQPNRNEGIHTPFWEQSLSPPLLRVSLQNESQNQCNIIQKQFKPPKQKLPGINNDKRLRMQFRTVPFPKKRYQKVKFKAKKASLKVLNQKKDLNQESENKGGRGVSQVKEPAYYGNQVFNSDQSRSITDNCDKAELKWNQFQDQHGHQGDQYIQNIDQRFGEPYQTNETSSNYRFIGERENSYLKQSNKRQKLRHNHIKQRDGMAFNMQSHRQQETNQLVYDSGYYHQGSQLQDHGLQNVDYNQNNQLQAANQQQSIFQQAAIQEQVRSYDAAKQKPGHHLTRNGTYTSNFDNDRYLQHKKGNARLETPLCKKCSCCTATLTPKPFGQTQDDKLQIDGFNPKVNSLSQQQQSSENDGSNHSCRKANSSSVIPNSQKDLKKRRSGKPQIGSEENYMFPSDKKKEPGMSYFQWKQQILIENRIKSLHHIKDPMPGAKMEMDEQKYRFIQELNTAQGERNRIKSELDHFYAYQNKQAQFQIDADQVSRRSQSQKKDIEINRHLMRVQWSLKRIGHLSLRERFSRIENFRERREQREWDKKVSYDCRKVVADNRLRVKGRFVKKEQQDQIKNNYEHTSDQKQHCRQPADSSGMESPSKTGTGHRADIQYNLKSSNLQNPSQLKQEYSKQAVPNQQTHKNPAIKVQNRSESEQKDEWQHPQQDNCTKPMAAPLQIYGKQEQYGSVLAGLNNNQNTAAETAMTAAVNSVEQPSKQSQLPKRKTRIFKTHKQPQSHRSFHATETSKTSHTQNQQHSRPAK